MGDCSWKPQPTSAPAARTPSSTTPRAAKASEHAAGVGEPVPAHARAATPPACSTSASTLIDEHREHAGHQVEDDAADQGEQRGLQHRRERCGLVRRGVPGRSPTLVSSNACFAVVAPSASSTTSTPPASVGAAVDSALRSRRRTRPSRVTSSCCGAACRTSVSALGKKKAERTAPGVQALGSTSSVSPSGATSMRATPGRGLRQGPARGVEGGRRGCVRRSGAPGPATGRLSDRLASPGMHSFSHTSQVTSALRATGAAASSGRRRDAGEQRRLALVAEVERDGRQECAAASAMRSAGCEARRQLPGDGRRLARIARIAPVDVPVVLDAQAQADPERLTRGSRPQARQRALPAPARPPAGQHVLRFATRGQPAPTRWRSTYAPGASAGASGGGIRAAR